MSIINDALKKAGKANAPSQNKPSMLISKVDEIKTDAERFLLKRRLLWTGTGVVCLIGIIAAVSSFKSPADKTALNAAQEAKTTKNILSLKRPDSRAQVKNSDLILSGVLYDEQKPMAIINERILGVGGLVNEAQVLEIKPSLVKLCREGKEFSLKIK